jgi:hypothetical protein
MIDREVERLRRLRASALRVRAIASALGPGTSFPGDPFSGDPLLNRGRCAAWRIARTVSGRLRAHPYARFQKDAGIGVVVANGLAAANCVLGTKSRRRNLLRFEEELRALGRELADVRALTSASDLNDSFARSQVEIRSLLAALAFETGRAHAADAPPMTPAVADARGAGVVESDWPYLAF